LVYTTKLGLDCKHRSAQERSAWYQTRITRQVTQWTWYQNSNLDVVHKHLDVNHT
jgi:hypothetical protein